MESEESKIEEHLHTNIWYEEAEPDNPFLAKACYCSGYDVYGELLHKASWVEYLYLLFKLEKPADWQAKLLERLMVALGNPGPREFSVQAAMTAAVGGSGSAAALISAISTGAGQNGGAHEIYLAMQAWSLCGCDLAAWRDYLNTCSFNKTNLEADDVWPAMEYPPGFCFSKICATPVLQTLHCLNEIYSSGALGFLTSHRETLEEFTEHKLAMAGVAAAALIDLGFKPEQGEMLYLFMRLPGAMAHALEQYLQWKRYPFFKDRIILTEET